MRIDRRRFLIGSAATAGVAFVPGRRAARASGAQPVPTKTVPPVPRSGRFTHGVASGDPQQTSVLLWTRVHPGEPDAETVVAELTVARDPALRQVVRRTDVESTARRDWTVKVDVGDLDPGVTYYYQFAIGEDASPVGRTRTLPAAGVDHLRLAVASCSNLAYGYFHAYRHLAERADVDALIHLGDYLYEYGDAVGDDVTLGEVRTLQPHHECRTHDDYRQRYACYRSDPGLQEVHRQFPMIHVWDDHEFFNDPVPGGGENHQAADDGDVRRRISGALRAYDEWMPTRLDGTVVYRSFDFGDLAQLTLVDRQRKGLWPDEAPAAPLAVLDREQERWLASEISRARARWFVLGNGSRFGSVDTDQSTGGWGAGNREAVLRAVEDAGVENLVVLAGDIHKAEALDLVRTPGRYDAVTGAGSAGVELNCGSITSPGPSDPIVADQQQYSGGFARGYLVMDVTPDRCQADWFGFPDDARLHAEVPAEEWLAGFRTDAGANHLVPVGAPVETVRGAPALAP
jgi:alkaline phosphatase D